MSDLEIGDHKYRVAKMDVIAQAHVARKIAPVIFSMGKGYAMAAARMSGLVNPPVREPVEAAPPETGNGFDPHPELDETPEPEPDPALQAQHNEIMFDAMAPIADMLARMEEADVEYVLKKCLGVVSRHNGERYVPMMRGGNIMFDDIDLSTLMQLTMEVVQENLGPTLAGLLPQSLVGAAAPSP